MRIISGILYFIVMVYSLGKLFNPHTDIESFFYAFSFCSCGLGILADLREQIIERLKNK